MEEHHIMVVGAHCGDAEIASGAMVAKYTKAGHKATILHLTPGEKGHKFLAPSEYAEQKREEAIKAAKVLGAKCRFLPYQDAELPLNEKVKYEVCDIIRQVRPTILITHWKGSFHKDHVNTSLIVEDARFYAALPAIKRESPACTVSKLYYGENWEDPYDYVPDTFIDITDVYDQWLEAVNQYELFSGQISSFRYVEYYKALAVMRGCLSHKYQYAVALMQPRGANIYRGSHIPGCEL